MTTKTLKLAMNRAASLPTEAQEEIGREVLERVNHIDRVRAQLEIGIRQLDAGYGKSLDFDALIDRLHKEYDAG